MIALSGAFFITALLYAVVGFGGGSTYSALLVLTNTDYRILPSIALICNLIVVSGGAYRFYKADHIDLKRIAPWIITSVPAAWIGGYIDISKEIFTGLLGFSLLLSGTRMLITGQKQYNLDNVIINENPIVPLIIGGILGLLAGLVGIGGGIFLAPILYMMKWDNAKKIAATCSIFILVNSLSGIIGQAMKLDNLGMILNITGYWLLFPAVFIGGQIGSYMSAAKLNPDILRLLTSALILYVSIRLLVSLI